MAETLNYTFFSSQIEQLFQLDLDSEEVSLRLIKVDIHPNNNNQTRDPFSLVFRGLKEQPLQQGTFILNNKNSPDSIAVFLVPIGPDAQGLCYEAVFN